MGDKLSTEETKAKEEEDDKSNHLREADIGAISPSVPDPGSGVEALPVYSFGSSSPAAVEYPISGAEQVDLSGLPDDNIQQLGNFEQPFDFFDHHPYQNYPIFAGYNEYHTFMDAACHQHDHEEKLLTDGEGDDDEEDDDMDRKLSPDSDRKLSPITTQPRGVPTCLYPEEPPKVLPYAYLDHTEGLDDESEDTGSHPSPVVRPSPVTAPLVLKPSPVASTKKQRNKKSPKKTPPKKKAQRTKRKIDNTPTLAGEGTKERKEPTKEELDAEKNDRSQGALVNWYNRLNDLYGYKKIHGDTNVPQKYKENPQLGIWVNKQRMELKKYAKGEESSITQQKFQRLQKAGFNWAKLKGEAAWDASYNALVQYKKRHGNCHVKTKCSEHRTLGRWVSTQRQMYKRYFNGQFKGRIEEEIEKEKTKMKQRIDMLEKLDFIWNFSSSFSEDDDGSGTDKSHE